MGSITSNGTRMVGLVTLIVALVGLPPEVCAKGLDWHVEFGEGATNDGTLIFNIYLDQTGTRTIEIEVTEGMTDEEKAGILADSLNARAAFQSTFSGDMVDFEVHDAWASDNTIDGLSVEDSGTGEEIEYWYDDPPPEILVNISLDILSGVGTTGGWFSLGIGQLGPLATASTEGKAGPQIETELLSAFTALYPEYTAVVQSGVLRVEKVPCPLGAAFGTNDTSLTYSFTMRRTWVAPEQGPGLTVWGITVLSLLVLASGAYVLRRRQRAVEA